VKNDKSFLNYKKCNLYHLVYILRLRVKVICIKWLSSYADTVYCLMHIIDQDSRFTDTPSAGTGLIYSDDLYTHI